MRHDHLFAFESDFVATLRCVPMAVRFKLDRVEIKLTLRQWSRFTPADRRILLTTPCATAEDADIWRCMLIALIAARAGEEPRILADPPAPLWELSATPEAVTRFAGSLGAPPPSDRAWTALAPLQRYVLLKLTRDSHDNVNFLPAMAEFGLAVPAGDGLASFSFV